MKRFKDNLFLFSGFSIIAMALSVVAVAVYPTFTTTCIFCVATSAAVASLTLSEMVD